MQEFYTFPDCDCKFKILGPSPSGGDVPLVEFDYETIDADCHKVWDLLATGMTIGIFQLEDSGKFWSKRLRPENLTQVADLSSILRPGCSHSLDEHGVSLSEKYCRRKNNEEETIIPYEALKNALSSTYGILIYQEQAIQIAKDVAGFSLQEADSLRKAIGKKLAEEMAKVKKMFIEGAKNLKRVTDEQAEEIFGWIEQSQRYSFNKSHAITYSVNTCRAAFMKSHFPLHFFCSSLREAENLEEARVLIVDAKKFNIDIYPPSILDPRSTFFLEQNHIRCGLVNIRGVGAAQIPKITKLIKDNESAYGNIKDWTWFQIFTRIVCKLTKDVAEGMIQSGCFKHFGITRKEMLADYGTYSILIKSKPQKGYIEANKDKWTTFLQMLEDCAKHDDNGGPCTTKAQIVKVESLIEKYKNPSTAMIDYPNEIASNEEHYLGAALTCSHADGKPGERANTTCKEYIDGHAPPVMILKVLVEDIFLRTVKKLGKNFGREMCSLRISDSTCSIDNIPCFPDDWEKYKNILSVGRILEMQVEKAYKKDGLTIKQIWEI